MPKLTDKQQAFVKEYIINGGNGTQAAISAGYSENCAQEIASENLSKPLIKAELEAHREDLQESFKITAETKFNWLKEIVERSMQHEQVMDKDGPTGEFKFAGGDAIRAINEINKMDGGHAAEKLDINDTTDIAARLRKAKDAAKE